MQAFSFELDNDGPGAVAARPSRIYPALPPTHFFRFAIIFIAATYAICAAVGGRDDHKLSVVDLLLLGLAHLIQHSASFYLIQVEVGGVPLAVCGICIVGITSASLAITILAMNVPVHGTCLSWAIPFLHQIIEMVLLMIPAACCSKRRRMLIFVSVMWPMSLHLGLLALVLMRVMQKYWLPPILAGALLPLVCLLLQKGSWKITVYVWKHLCHGDCWPLLPAALAGLVLSAAESVRLAGMIYGIRRERLDSYGAFIQTITSLVIGSIAETVNRNRLPHALWSAVVWNKCYQISPETDLILRTRFYFYDYPPHLIFVLMILLYLITDQRCFMCSIQIQSSLRSIAVVFASAIASVLTDAIVLILQHCMRSESGRLDLTRSSLKNTLVHLRNPGGHVAPYLCIRGNTSELDRAPSGLPQEVRRVSLNPPSQSALVDMFPGAQYQLARTWFGILLFTVIIDYAGHPVEEITSLLWGFI